MPDNKPFWRFSRSSKIDVLCDRLHTRTMLRALSDQETHIEICPSGGYILFNEESGLLAKPENYILKVGFLMYCMIMTYLTK